MALSRSGLIIAGVSTTVGIAESIIAFNIAQHAVSGGGKFKLSMPPLGQLFVTFIALSVAGYVTGMISDSIIQRIEMGRLQTAAGAGDAEAAAALAQAPQKTNFTGRVVPLPFHPKTKAT